MTRGRSGWVLYVGSVQDVRSDYLFSTDSLREALLAAAVLESLAPLMPCRIYQLTAGDHRATLIVDICDGRWRVALLPAAKSVETAVPR